LYIKSKSSVNIKSDTNKNNKKITEKFSKEKFNAAGIKSKNSPS
jgi:hypothetical protein